MPAFQQVQLASIVAVGGGGSGTIIQHIANGTAGATTVAVTVTATGTGRLLVAGIICDAAVTVSGVSDGTNAFTKAASSAAADGSSRSEVWYLLSSTSGKTTITATFSGSSFGSIFFFEVSWTGSPSLDTSNGVATNAIANVATGAAVTSTGSSGFIVGVCVPSNFVDINPNTGNEFSSGGDIDGTTGAAACSLIASTAASHTPTWHVNGASNQTFVSSTAAFK